MAARVAMVTGASSGIGGSTARRLAGDGFTTIVAGRTPASAHAAAADVRSAQPGASVIPVSADLSRQDEVRRLAEQVRAVTDRLDVLINNAGANFPGRLVTVDGVEQTLAIDTVAPLLLSLELLPLLRTGAGRVVNVASGLLKAPVPEMWTGPQPYSQISAYSQAKAALVLLTEQFALHHPDVLAVSMTPGPVRTRLDRNAAGSLKVFLALVKLVARSPDAAAHELVNLATVDPATLRPSAFYRRGRPAAPTALTGSDGTAIWNAFTRRIATTGPG